MLGQVIVAVVTVPDKLLCRLIYGHSCVLADVVYI